MRQGNEVCRRRRGERWKGTSADDDGDGVLSAEGEGALVVFIGVPVGEKAVIGACVEGAGRVGEERADLCRLVREGNG